MDEVVEFCNVTGCKNVVISMLPFECILGDEDKFYTFISTLDGWYDKYAERGITLAYHHHNWEYIRLSSGRTRMAELLSKTEKIKFVHDTYWTARSGVSPDDQIREFGSRLLGIHLRDLAFKKKLLDVVPHDTAIGDGVIDFVRVLAAVKEVGCEYTVIEQKTNDPYGDIKKSFNYLNKIKSQIEE
jgi:sugar phosphate isomerase/epimerase